MRKFTTTLFLSCIGACHLSQRSAHAAFIFNISQAGANILISGSGSVNTSALTFQSVANTSPYLFPGLAVLVAGPTAENSFAIYGGASGPASFGNGQVNYYPTGTGDYVGTARGSVIDLPINYISGSSLIVDDIISGESFANVGLIAGTYVDKWGSGPTADSLTINIGVVPEPASLAMIALPLGVAQLRRRRGRRLS